MKLSLNWLKDYVNLPKNVTAQKLAQDLTMTTVEVENVENLAEKFEKMVAGKIVAIERHLNADKLMVVFVDIGKALKHESIKALKQKSKLQVVCGGTNLREGMLVVVALPGAKVRWHGEGEPVIMEKAKIRGVESFGMICAASEIGLADMFPAQSEREIIDLSEMKNLKPGQLLAKALATDDTIIEIDNKSLTNRPDLWSHYGIARELAVIYDIELKEKKKNRASLSLGAGKKVKEIKKYRNSVQGGSASGGKEIKGNNLEINIHDKELCPRYIGCLIKNVKVAPSPAWLQKRLSAIGIRPISNIVDITNYVMLDVGEPMHAFDISKLNPPAGGQNSKLIEIKIRKAKNGEKIKSLDGVERKLDDSMLVIANEEKPIAIAGIMGGEESGIDEKTTDIIFEAANFNAMSIRKTSQKLGLRSESSIRFEKSLAANLAEMAMARALELLKEFCPQAEVVAYQDKNFVKEKKIEIKVEHEFLEKRIGQTLDTKDVVNILEKLGFIVKCQSVRVSSVKETHYTTEVPSWRTTGDVSIPEDIVEEVARVIGYDNLAEHKIMVELAKPKIQIEHILENRTKKFLALAGGFSEVFNYPWASEKTLKILGENDKIIEVGNPLSVENSALQNSLISNLLKNTEDNLRYFDEFKIFELARVFIPEFSKLDNKFQDRLPYQPKMLSGVVVTQKDKSAFLELKGALECLLNKLQVTSYELRVTNPSQNYLDGEKFLSITVNGQEYGWLGELKESVYNQFNFKKRKVALFEINFDKLIQNIVGTPARPSGGGLDLSVKYKPLPQFPSIIRDLAFELSWNIKWADICSVILIRQLAEKNPLVRSVEFLSEFGLGDKKSVAFRITYQTDRTLKDKEVEVVEKKIIKMLGDKFNARLRAALGK